LTAAAVEPGHHEDAERRESQLAGRDRRYDTNPLVRRVALPESNRQPPPCKSQPHKPAQLRQPLDTVVELLNHNLND